MIFKVCAVKKKIYFAINIICSKLLYAKGCYISYSAEPIYYNIKKHKNILKIFCFCCFKQKKQGYILIKKEKTKTKQK